MIDDAYSMLPTLDTDHSYFDRSLRRQSVHFTLRASYVPSVVGEELHSLHLESLAFRSLASSLLFSVCWRNFSSVRIWALSAIFVILWLVSLGSLLIVALIHIRSAYLCNIQGLSAIDGTCSRIPSAFFWVGQLQWTLFPIPFLFGNIPNRFL